MPQITINGLADGLLIATLALSFASVYSTTGVFHLALGALYVLAPLVARSLLAHQAPWPLAIVIALILCSMLSLACELVNHGRLSRRNASPVAHLLSSLGIYMILVHGASMIWGDQAQVLRTSVDPAWSLSSVVITQSQVIGGSAGLGCFCTYCLLLRQTRLGLQFRAIAANPIEAGLRGMNVPRLRSSAFLIAGALAGLSGLLSAQNRGFRPQEGGFLALTLAVVAFIVGGRRSIWGVLLGGVIVGLVRSWASYLTSSQWQDAVSYALFVFFIVARPRGLFGVPQRIGGQA